MNNSNQLNQNGYDDTVKNGAAASPETENAAVVNDEPASDKYSNPGQTDGTYAEPEQNPAVTRVGTDPIDTAAAVTAAGAPAADSNGPYKHEPTGGPAAVSAVTEPFMTRDEWERQQREIQDREWRNMQQIYNRQLAEQRSGQNARQDDYPNTQEWYNNNPYGGYVNNYQDRNDASAYQRNSSWQPYDARYGMPAGAQTGPAGAPNAPYGGSQNGQYNNPANGPYNRGANGPYGTAGYQDAGYYYDMNQTQRKTPRYGEKQNKRKLRVRVLAASVAAALIIATVFGAGYLVGNNGLNFGVITGSTDAGGQKNNVTAADTPSGHTVKSGTPADSKSEWTNPGGLFGNQQSQAPATTPSGQQEQNGAGAPAGQDQPQQQQAQAQTQTQTQVAGGSANSGGVSALTLNPPSENELSVPEIYQKVYPSIVGVRITFLSQAYRFGGIMMPGQELSGEGSGIIIREDGYIMTNHHVVSQVIDTNTRQQLDGTKIDVFLPDDSATAYPATIVGFDQSTDLCVLKIDKSGLRAAELGDAEKLVVGEFVVAIGNPGGMEYMSSATFGIISGLNRSIQTEGYKNIQLIQTDAAINPGNSGGALINKSGQVIGVNSIKIADTQFEGLGFAIPINAAVRICEDLMNFTYVTGRPYIGITAYSQYTEQLASQYNMPKGVYVYEVDETGPADTIIHKNDIIVKFNAAEVTNFDSLETEKNKYKPGDTITIQVYRDWSTNDYQSGKYVDVTIVLGEKKN